MANTFTTKANRQAQEALEKLIEREDRLWARKAEAAAREGFLSEEKSERLLNELLHPVEKRTKTRKQDHSGKSPSPLV